MKTKVLMRIIPARRPVLMASCKIVVPLHFIAYTLYIWIRVVISGIDAPGIIDYVINTIFLLNTVCYLLLYIDRFSTVYCLTEEAIIRVRRFGAYKSMFQLKYSDIHGNIRYYKYDENIGVIYINKKLWGAYWDNSRFHITSNRRKRSMVMYYIRNGEAVCDFINQLRNKHN